MDPGQNQQIRPSTLAQGPPLGFQPPRPFQSPQSPQPHSGDSGDGFSFRPYSQFALGDALPFPLHALSPAWKTWVEDAARLQRVSPDIAGTNSLGALSAIAAWRDVPLLVADGALVTSLNLYTVAIEESGANKSSIHNLAIAPLAEIEAGLRDDPSKSREREHAAAEHTAAVAKVKALTEQLEKQARTEAEGKAWKGQSRDALTAALADAELALKELPRPRKPRLLADDATPESLVPLLANNPAICLATSEAQGVFALFTGRYGKGANLELLLKAFDGDSHHVDRRGGEPLYLPRPYLALVLSAQPVTVMRLAGFDGDLYERGLIARILWSYPSTLCGYRDSPPDEGVSSSVAAGYREMFQRIHGLVSPVDDRGTPCPMRLTDEARALTREFYRATEPRIAEGADWAWCRSVVSKMRTQVLRIAGLLHLCDGRSPNEPITADVVGRALELAHYYLDMGQRVLGAMREDSELTAARDLWQFAMRHATPHAELGGMCCISQRDLYQSCKGKFQRVADLQAPLDQLVSHGYVAIVRRMNAGPGRPPSPWIVLNPEALPSSA